ncbi:MAG: amidophosphoribosyltransferase [Arsenophonus sp.]|nr:MAG: amidophosphoribosyltransferase [Arsenophonus sp.]
MCGIIGIYSFKSVSQMIYNGLLTLQHRGQDASGIATIHKTKLTLIKKKGLVKNIFNKRNILNKLKGNIGIGHVRYSNRKFNSINEAQPFYVNYPYGLCLVHNGNITNKNELKNKISIAHHHINSYSDSEILLNIIAYQFSKYNYNNLCAKNIFNIFNLIFKEVKGAYSCILLIIGYGLIAFRDPNGIRPLVIGTKYIKKIKKKEYMIASESITLESLGFQEIRDVNPGEVICLEKNGKFYNHKCIKNTKLIPCLFEFIYFARPDSYIDNISVSEARLEMGKILAKKIKKTWKNTKIDVVIPIPDTSYNTALEISRILNIPYRQGFIKNNYSGRSFIINEKNQRNKTLSTKFIVNKIYFKNKNILLIDDSIIRGDTAKKVIFLAKTAGAKKIFFASAAPQAKFANIYGINIPSSKKLISYNRKLKEIKNIIGADKLIFQDLKELIKALKKKNKKIENFESSIFNGKYIT